MVSIDCVVVYLAYYECMDLLIQFTDTVITNFSTIHTIIHNQKVMFWWINVQDDLNSGAIILTVFTIAIIGHVIATFSALGRLVMSTSAMGHTPILSRHEEESLLPHQLSNVLLGEAQIARLLQTKVNQQYKFNCGDTAEHQPSLTYEMSLRKRFPDIELDETV
jgi:hypothetical protein